MATNFQNITESPEKLAEFLDKLMGSTGCCIPVEVEESVNDCDAKWCPYMVGLDCGFNTIEWLQEECE